MDTTESSTIRIIAEESGKRPEDIHIQDTLLADLGIDGDDAWAVLERLHDELGVDFSKLNFSSYFRSEPCFKGLVYYYKRLKGQDQHVASGKNPITVGSLVEAGSNGYWS